MATAADLKKKLGDIKARPLILIVGLVLVLGIIIIIFSWRRGNNAAVEGNFASKTAPVPAIKSTPGVGETQDKTYNQLQLEQNRLRAQQAEQTGGSAVPTLINQPGSIVSLEAQNTRAEDYQKLLEEQNRRNAERMSAEQQATTSGQQQQAQQAFEGLMQKQANELLKRWQPVAEAVVGGQVLPKSATAQMQTVGGSATNVAGTAAVNAKIPALYKAGDIVFGVLETGINSDEPGPILVRIVSGPLKGAKLIGSIQLQNDKLMLQFNKLSAPSLPNSVGVSVVAIDPETARTALASDVNHHYLVKYGVVFAASFLQGVSQAVQSSLQPSFTASNNTFTATATTASTKQQVLVGLGQVGQQISQNLQQYQPKPTVTIDEGTSLGLLFLNDFSLAAGEHVTNPETKPVTLEQTLSAQPVPGGTTGTAKGVAVQTASTSVSTSAPLPGTVGPHNQTQESTVTTTIQQPVNSTTATEQK